MWNLISCSKLTEQKIRKKSYDQHVNKVKRMKSNIKITQPQQPWFVYVKSKKELSRNDQLKQIERQNTLLLKKMHDIQIRQNNTFKNSTFLTTLNSKIVNDTNQYIYKQNQRICEKIMKTEAFYKTQNILQNTTNLQKVMNNISNNSRRVQSAKFIAQSKSRLSRPQSSSVLRRPISSYSVKKIKSPYANELKEAMMFNENSERKARAMSAHPINRKIFHQEQTQNHEEINTQN